MRKEAFSFDSRDGETKLHAIRYLPDEGVPIRGVVQIVHGMSEYFERYEPFSRYLTEHGFVVTGDDHMGHGESVAEGMTFGYFCRQDPATVLVRDEHRLKKITQELFPGVPYLLIGHSMGSFIVRNYLCRYGTGISAAVLLGTGMPSGMEIFLSKTIAAMQQMIFGPKHVAKLLDRLIFGAYQKRISNPRTSYDWLTRERDIVEAYLKDPFCGFTFTLNGFSALLELIARVRRPKNLAQIPVDLPVLFASGDADPVGDYGKGVRAACESLEKAGMKHLTLKLYPGARHEVLNETNREEVYADLLDWMEQNAFSSPKQGE